MDPAFEIPGPHDVTFKRPSSDPVDPGTLSGQMDRLGLWRHETVVGLGGTEYRAAVAGVFGPHGSRVRFPFAGLSLGLGLRAIRRAVDSGRP